MPRLAPEVRGAIRAGSIGLVVRMIAARSPVANTAAVASVEVAARSNRILPMEHAETSSQAVRPWAYPLDRRSVYVRHRIRDGSFED